MHAYSTAFLSIMNTPTINSNAYRTQGLSIVVFGASGHLARVKIMPSLFRLFGHDKLPPFTFIYGYARTKMTSEEWRESLKRDLMSISGANSDLVTEFLSKCVYVSGDSYRDVAAYSRLEKLIREQEDQHSLMYQQANRMFYLAVPPNVFIDTAMSIHLHCMQTRVCGWTRIVVEKPFGRDLATYQELQHALSSCFDESIIYRIDHYLAKTMVEQIIPLRQNNLWKKRISSVYIVWKETHSLKSRGGGYFDHYGIVRDVVQNHLLQLLTLIAMELNDDVSIHERKCKVLEQTRVVGPALFGQYQGYGNDVGNAESNTPTYALVQLQVNTPQWNGVPFIIEAGKALHESVCEIRLQLDSPGCVEVVVLRIQPNPSTIYHYDRVSRTRIKALEWSKTNTSKIVSVPLAYKKTTFPNFTEDAYSTLLCHVLKGNKEQFVHNDELEMSWKIVTPILEPRKCEIQQYEQGSCGPPGRMEFLERAEIPNAACSFDINNAGTIYLQSSL